MSRSIPAPVRAAHKVLQDIQKDTDPQDWEKLRRQLPALALRLAAAGEVVDEARLTALARGPKDVFNRAARGGRSLAEVAALFAPETVGTGSAQARAHSLLPQFVAAVRAQDAAETRRWRGQQGYIADNRTFYKVLGHEEDFDMPLSVSFFESIGRSLRIPLESQMEDEACRSYLRRLALPLNRDFLFHGAQTDKTFLLLVLAAVLDDTDLLADILDHFPDSHYLNFGSFKVPCSVAIKHGNFAVFKAIDDFARRRDGHIFDMDMISNCARYDKGIPFLDHILSVSAPEEYRQHIEECTIKEAITFSSASCLRALAARGVSFDETRLQEMLVQAAGMSLWARNDVSLARAQAVYAFARTQPNFSMDIVGRILAAQKNQSLNPFLQDLQRNYAAHIKAQNARSGDPLETVMDWQGAQLAAALAAGPAMKPVVYHLLGGLYGPAAPEMAQEHDPFGMPVPLHLALHYAQMRRFHNVYGRPVASAAAGLLDTKLHRIVEAVRMGDDDEAARGMDYLRDWSRRMEAIIAEKGDAAVAARHREGLKQASQSLALALLAPSRDEYNLMACARLGDVLPDFTRHICAHLVNKEAWFALAELAEQDLLVLPPTADDGKAARHIAQAQKWRRHLPGRTVDREIFDWPPEFIKPALFTEVAAIVKDDRKAYRAAALFRSPETLGRYAERWGDRKQDFAAALGRILTVNSFAISRETDVKAWGDAILRDGPEMMHLMIYADRLHRPAATLQATREMAAIYKYPDGYRNPPVAALCARWDVSWDGFERALRLIAAQKEKPEALQKNLPAIRMAGEEFGLPGLNFAPLRPDDPRGLFLGKMVDCCQHIDRGNAAWCAEHGFLSPEGGFYVVTAKNDEVIGMSWAWRGTKGELVFDSLETLGNRLLHEDWDRIVTAFAARLGPDGKDVTAVLAGMDGQNIARLDRPEIQQAAKPRDHRGYNDSCRQYLVWAREDYEYALVPGFVPRTKAGPAPAP